MKYILISLVIILTVSIFYFSCKSKKIVESIIIKHDTTVVTQIHNIEHYTTVTKVVYKNNKKLLDSFSAQLNIKPKQIENISNEVIKVQGVAEGQFVDAFGDASDREYKFSDSFIHGYAICDSDSIRLQYEGQFKLNGTLYWKYDHLFPILRTLWDTKTYYQDFYTNNKNIKVDSIFSLIIKKQ